jgi:uncharacterized protein (TIGR04255 family)
VNVVPCREQNAIKMVAFVFEFQTPFSGGALEVIESLHQDDDDGLPGVQRHEEVAFQLGPNGVQSSHSSSAGGITFQCVAPDGEVQWAFTAQQQTAIIRCADYSRWASIFQRSKSLLAKYLPILFEGNAITSVGLEYRDEFKVMDPSASWREELFNVNSNHIPSMIFGMEDLWHSHSGFFSPEDEKGNKLLTRINLDYLDAGKNQRLVSVVTHHRIALNQIVSEDVEGFLGDPMIELFEEMHSVNKDVFSNMLSEQMKDIIKLGGGHASS